MQEPLAKNPCPGQSLGHRGTGNVWEENDSLQGPWIITTKKPPCQPQADM